MKRVQRLEYENARLREEIEQLRKTVQKKEKKIERLEFGIHIVTGYITSISEVQDTWDISFDRQDCKNMHVEFEVKAIKFPTDLMVAFWNRSNTRLKFTIELDNE